MQELRKFVELDDTQFKQKYNTIFEKWTSKNAHDEFGFKELYWVLLAELIERAPNDKIKEINQRVQARIIYASRKTPISVGFMHFVHVSLLKCPKLLINNSETFNSLAFLVVNLVCKRYLNGINVRFNGELELAIDILFRVTEFRFSDVLLITIRERLVKTVDNATFNDRFPLDILKEYNLQNETKLVVFLWMVHYRLVNKAKKGSKVDLMAFLKAFEVSMESKNKELQEAACDAVTQLSRSIGVTFCVISSHIIRILSKDLNILERMKFTILKELNENLGVGSNIYQEFNTFSRQLIKLLNEESFENSENELIIELVDLIISIFRNCRIFLNPKHLTELQTSVCIKALKKQPSIEILKLLNALLMFNHDLVPFPLEIAHSIFQQNYLVKSDPKFLAEINLGISLCEVFTRPQIPSIYVTLPKPLKDNEETEIIEEQSTIISSPKPSFIEIEVSEDEEDNDSEQDIPLINLDESDGEEAKKEKVVEVIEESFKKGIVEKDDENEQQLNKSKIQTVQEIMSCFYLE